MHTNELLSPTPLQNRKQPHMISFLRKNIGYFLYSPGITGILFAFFKFTTGKQCLKYASLPETRSPSRNSPSFKRRQGHVCQELFRDEKSFCFHFQRIKLCWQQFHVYCFWVSSFSIWLNRICDDICQQWKPEAPQYFCNVYRQRKFTMRMLTE